MQTMNIKLMFSQQTSLMQLFVNKIFNENVIQLTSRRVVVKWPELLIEQKDSISVVFFERELFASDETLNETYSRYLI